MAIFTFDQALKKTGAKASDVKSLGMPQSSLVAEKGVGERLSDTGTRMINRVSDNLSGTGEAAGKSVINRGINATAAVATGAIEGAIDLAPKPVRQTIGFIGGKIGEGFKALTDKIADTELFQGAAGNLVVGKDGKVDYIPNDTSTLENNLGKLSGLGEISGGILAAQGGTKTIQRGVDLSTKVASTTSDAFSDAASAIKNKLPGKKNIDPVETAIRDATPNYEASTPTQKGKLLERVEEGGVLKGRTVKSNALEIEAGRELSKVPGYNPSATKLSKYQVAKVEVGKRGQALEESLGKEKVVVVKSEVTSRVQKAVNDLPNKSLLLQSSDPVIKNYMRVFRNAFESEPGTLKGVLKLRKTLDDAYENARGKQAYGSDKISALDDVNKAVRDVLYKYLVEKAKNTDVKASLRSQWNLYRALDELQTAAERESGSIIGRFKQNNPILNNTVEMGVKAAGFGAGMGIIK